MSNKLKEARVEKGLSVAELADYIGVTKQAYYMYEKGERMPSMENLKKLSLKLGVSTDFLISGQDKGVSISELFPLPSIVRKPRLGTISCGQPIYAEQNFEQFDYVPEEIPCDFTLVCRGDSMVGAHITNGSIVYIRAQEDVENREIAAVLLNGDEVTLKRVIKNAKGVPIMLMPENSNYEPIDLSTVDDFKILGKAVGFISKI